MNFYLVFAAVLLTAVSAKVMPVPENAKVPDVSVPIEAHVVEIPKDHVAPMPVVDKIPTPLPIGVVKIPLSQSPQVSQQTTVEVKKSDMLVDAKQPVLEMPKVPEVTQLAPVSGLVTQTAQVPVVTVPTVAKDVSTPNDPSHCDILCTKFELNPICAVSTDCVHEFPNQCVLDTFNCLHPDRAFKAVKDESCKMHWLKHCTEKEVQM